MANVVYKCFLYPHPVIWFANQVQRKDLQCHLDKTLQDHLDLACKKLAVAHIKTDDLSQNLERYEKRLSQLEDVVGIYQRGPTRDNGNLLWRITNYSQHWEAARNKTETSIYSDPFFSGRYGYKMMAALSPNGDGLAEDNSLSIYISIMKGKYDNLLCWPFRQKIKFTLLNQRDDFDKRKNIVVEMDPDVSLDGYKKPIEWKNTGVGIWKFVSHEMVNSEDFIVDDTLFVKVEVEPFDLLQ